MVVWTDTTGAEDWCGAPHHRTMESKQRHRPTKSWNCRSPLIHDGGPWRNSVTMVSISAVQGLTCVSCHDGLWAEIGSVYILREQLFQNQCCQAARHTHSLLLRSIRGSARGSSLPQMLETSNLGLKLSSFIFSAQSLAGLAPQVSGAALLKSTPRHKPAPEFHNHWLFKRHSVCLY